MYRVEFTSKFTKNFKKITDKSTKDKIKKLILKISENPNFGKPMRYERKGSREVYLDSYRLSYVFYKEKITILILDIYHKNKQ